MNKNKFFAYPLSLIYGLYFYLVFQLIFFINFGRINNNLTSLDLTIYIVGVLSVLLCMYFSRKLTRKYMYWLWVFFVTAIPFGYTGALGGGLIAGHLGILIMGTLPFIIALSVGYLIIKKVSKNR